MKIAYIVPGTGDQFYCENCLRDLGLIVALRKLGYEVSMLPMYLPITAEDHLADESPIFYGYYADYDWVIFCWIFGKMIDLPEGFPMYCNDIKQLMTEHGITTKVEQDEGTQRRWRGSLHEAIGRYF